MNTTTNVVSAALIFLCFDAFAQSDITLHDEQVNSVSESVTVSVRCPEGGVAVGGEYIASRQDVVLIEETGMDCPGGECAAWQMTFTSQTPEAFNITAKARCQGVESEE